MTELTPEEQVERMSDDELEKVLSDPFHPLADEAAWEEHSRVSQRELEPFPPFHSGYRETD